MKRAKKAKAIKARKEKEKTKLDKLNEKIKTEKDRIAKRDKISTKGAYGDSTKKYREKLKELQLQKKALTRPISDKKDFSDFGSSGSSPKTKKSAGYSPRAGKLREKSGSVKPINTNPQKEDKGIGEKIVNELKGETRRQQSQLNKPKETLKPLEQGVRKSGRFTIDSTDEGMSKFMGTDKEIAEQEMEEEMNLRKGGAVAKKYGMREGGFTKRGGMYKKGYS
jgi:hypothetical protein